MSSADHEWVDCDARMDLAGSELCCYRSEGHDGIHIAAIVLNGEECDTGWRDGDKGAYRAAPLPVPAQPGDSE